MILKKLIIYLLKSKLVSYILSREFIFKIFTHNKLIIFLFHEVNDTPSQFHKDHNLNIFPDIFEKQIKMVKDHFNILSPKNLLDKNLILNKTSAMITFDDGSLGYFKNAVPICEKHKVESIHFLNMAPILGEVWWSGLISYLFKFDKKFKKILTSKNKNPIQIDEKFLEEYLESHNKEEIYKKSRAYYGEFATLSDLKSASLMSNVFFGNHLYNHFNSTVLSEHDLNYQYNKNRDLLNEYDNSLEYFSYPFGQKKTCYNKKTNSMIKLLGAKKIFTANAINYNINQDILHRVSVKNDIQDINRLKSHIILSQVKNYFIS